MAYFSCTLGEAAQLVGEGAPRYPTITALLAGRARESRDDAAVGFPVDGDHVHGDQVHEVYSFVELYTKVLDVSDLLLSNFRLQKGQSVALLATSGRDFCFFWLALVQLGCSVVLVAPEVTNAAIASLCASIKAALILTDQKHAAKAEAAVKILAETVSPNFTHSVLPAFPRTPSAIRQLPLGRPVPSDAAYWHHTSGTSTGFPKPIRITHHGAVGVLPCFDDRNAPATFSTTPLYHGGPADCFRAWSSGAMIWLYPGVADSPVTTKNILHAMQIAENYSRHPMPSGLVGKVGFLTAVPYIVELLASDELGRQLLKNMTLVGTGGAALSAKVGISLVEDGVRVISRYGSAECGFMMSSYRDFAAEKDWEYLRGNQIPMLRFEEKAGEAYELVASGWPFMAKPDDNQEYRTGDLFTKHPTKPGLWKYAGRADSQMTLSSGLKFDPAPLEAAIQDAVRPLGLVKDLFIFGEGQLVPGVFLVRHESTANKSDREILDTIWPSINSCNATFPVQATIRKHMLVLLHPTDAPSIAKSNKGSLLRAQTVAAYKDLIHDAYHRISPASNQPMDIGAVCKNIQRIVTDIMVGHPMIAELPVEDNLHDVGADSTVAMGIRDQLQRDYGQAIGQDLSPMIVYDCGSIKGLGRHIISLYTGQNTPQYYTAHHEIEKFFHDFQYEWRENDTLPAGPRNGKPTLNGEPTPPPSSSHDGEVVLLTGVTGTLGVWIFNILRNSPHIKEVHCLIRGADADAAEQRLRKALAHKKLPPLKESSAQVHWHPCKLADSATLGLSPSTHKTLVETTTLIIHAAWAVNFNLPLQNFRSHLQGLRNLLDLAISSPKAVPPKFIFCSSTASVLTPSSPTKVEERIYHPPPTSNTAVDLPTTGYAQSKVVAERICDSANANTKLRGRIAVLRIGQLCGDEERGVWNVTEAWPLMLSSVKVTGALPDLGSREKLGWLKVDVAAGAVVEVAMAGLQGQLGAVERGQVDGEEELGQKAKGVKEAEKAACKVFHIVNSSTTPTWTDLLGWMKGFEPGLEVLQPREWVERLEGLEGEAKEHPARKLLGLWKSAYCGEQNVGEGSETKGEVEGEEEGNVAFEMVKTFEVAPTLRDVKPIDEASFGRIWRWIQSEL